VRSLIFTMASWCWKITNPA